MTARILIVDDVPANSRLLEATLTSEYYQVAAARDGFEALRLAKDWQPDLILLDVMMPGMDGFECCRRLKEEGGTHHIPVVIVTALGEQNERLRGLEAGADDFLTKPVEFETLLARLRNLVRLKRLLDEWRARGETARALGLATEPRHLPSVAGATVLVIDDVDATANVVQDALAREGMIIGRARSEDQALAQCAEVKLDLVVLSLALSEVDPLQLASRLRAEDSTQAIPQLLIADREQRVRLLRGFDLGANDWLLRPLDENELRVRARNQVRRKFYQEQLRADAGQALELALTDPLTGLYNHRYLMRLLEVLLSSDAPNGIALLMIDIDHFKQVNDIFGHPAGDAALRQIAESLRSHTRVFDALGRYGGEEFVVVMPATSLPEAAAAAERLRAGVEAIVFEPSAGVTHALTASIGVACSNDRRVAPDMLLKAADQALYKAKRQGRNKVESAKAF